MQGIVQWYPASLLHPMKINLIFFSIVANYYSAPSRLHQVKSSLVEVTCASQIGGFQNWLEHDPLFPNCSMYRGRNVFS